jgi:hypothetical protein
VEWEPAIFGGRAKGFRDMGYACEALFGVERGQEIQALIESASGAPCPCKVGLACLLVAQVAEAVAPLLPGVA